MQTLQTPEYVESKPQNATLVTRSFPRGRKLTIFGKSFMAPLFFLAAGLSHLPAAIIYTPLGFSRSIGTGGLTGSVQLTLDLPGESDLYVAELTYGNSNFYQIYGTATVPADEMGSLYYWHSLNVEETWNDLPSGQTTTGWGANISRMAQTGNDSYDLRTIPTYLPFRFTDTTDLSTKYGYVALSTSLTGSGTSALLNLDISGYAYDDSGAKIAMGAVPEPSTAISAALGLLGITLLRVRRV